MDHTDIEPLITLITMFMFIMLIFMDKCNGHHHQEDHSSRYYSGNTYHHKQVPTPPSRYYNYYGQVIMNPRAYAATGAPMYTSQHGHYRKNINKITYIYKLELEHGKKYIGKTEDPDRRMYQHFSGNGAKVTQKFKPIKGEIIDKVPGYFSDEVEQAHTNKFIKQYGYNNVRGGKYVNSHTLQ